MLLLTVNKIGLEENYLNFRHAKKQMSFFLFCTQESVKMESFFLQMGHVDFLVSIWKQHF